MNTPMMTRSTEIHLSRCTSGDRDALARLLEKSLPELYEHAQRAVTAALGRTVSTRDVAHDAIVHILEHAPAIRTPTWETWLGFMRTVVRNHVIDQYRFHRAGRRDLARRTSLDDLQQVDLTPGDSRQATPSAEAAAHEIEGLVKCAVQMLPDDYRLVIQLRDFAGETREETARILGRPSVDAVGMLYQRAKGRLGTILAGIEDGQLSELLGRAEQEAACEPEAAEPAPD